MNTLNNLLRSRLAALRGAQNPHVFTIYTPVLARRAPCQSGARNDS